MIIEPDVSAAYDGKALIPDHPVNLQAGKKYHLIIEDIPPADFQKKSSSKQIQVCETAYMSERVLAREWLTSEEDEAWEYL
jgi:hypothetical protein